MSAYIQTDTLLYIYTHLYEYVYNDDDIMMNDLYVYLYTSKYTCMSFMLYFYMHAYVLVSYSSMCIHVYCAKTLRIDFGREKKRISNCLDLNYR